MEFHHIPILERMVPLDHLAIVNSVSPDTGGLQVPGKILMHFSGKLRQGTSLLPDRRSVLQGSWPLCTGPPLQNILGEDLSAWGFISDISRTTIPASSYYQITVRHVMREISWFRVGMIYYRLNPRIPREASEVGTLSTRFPCPCQRPSGWTPERLFWWTWK